MPVARASLIKSASASEFRTIMDATAPVIDIGGDSDPAPPQRTIADELREQLALRDAEIAGHADALAKAYAEGEEAGRFAAQDEFDQSRDEALALLESAITDARNAFAEALKGFENLAMQAASEALKILVADAEEYRRLLGAAIAQQVAALDVESIISITVSRLDFPDSRELAALETKMGSPPGTLKLSDERDAGTCHIALKVGTLEFDMQRSWDEISAILSGDASRTSAR